MEEEWSSPGSPEQQRYKSSFIEKGRSYGKGRGFLPHNNNGNEWRVGGKDYNGRDNDGNGFADDANRDDWDTDDQEAYSKNDGDFNDDGYSKGNNGRARDRGGHRGRGGDSFYRSRNNFARKNDADDDFEERVFRGSERDRGGHRGRGGIVRNFRDRGNENDNYGDDEDFGGAGEQRSGRRSGAERGYNNNNNNSNYNNNNRGRGGGGDYGGGSRSYDNDGEKAKMETYVPPEQPTDEKSLFGNGVEMGINFDKYDQIDVRVTGENAPGPIESFAQTGLRSLLIENIAKSGYKKPTPVQKHAIPIIMNGRDLMACAQTGSGKTAAFVVPIINTLLERPTDLVVTSTHCEPQVIIVSPTRELTIQIYQQVVKFAYNSILKTVIAYGGTSVLHQGNKISSGCHILVATPGRLLDFLGRGRITFSSVRFLVLDEADRMLDMGFLPDMERIVQHETMVPLGERQTLMFSATFPDAVQRLASKFLHNYLFLAVGIVGGACSDVEQTFYEVSKYKKRRTLKDLIEREADANIQRTLVFVEMKRTADFLAAFLSEHNYPTTSIHGDRMQREREEALRDFMHGRMPILIATAVAARGLDIRNVAHVINYDMPKGIDEYVHRIGRTGRVGNRGRATSFFDPETDSPLISDLVRILKQAGQTIPDWLECGGGSRTFAPGRAGRFGGEDVRNFSGDDEPTEKNLYQQDAYYAPVQAAAEPDETW